MTLLRVLTAVFVLICLAITVVILLQEGKQAGLTGAISGAADSYWGKNKGRSMEGKLEKATKVFVVLFFVIAIVLNMNKKTKKDITIFFLYSKKVFLAKPNITNALNEKKNTVNKTIDHIKLFKG